MEYRKFVTAYRWIVFALAGFYFLIAFDDLIPSEFGWQYRFLTEWALVMSLISAAFMLRRSMGQTTKRHDVWASATVVLNIMVVFLYWKIYFEDPSQFYVDGVRTIPLWKEYYLHLLGPILQWIDAFFILGAFRPVKRILALSVSVNILYIAWIEWIVSPMNAEPAGSVSSGLPYRFLNDMELADRMGFYVTNTISAIVLVGICWLIAAGLRRVRNV